jgi:tetratricopeptide (TPR) repeat protein
MRVFRPLALVTVFSAQLLGSHVSLAQSAASLNAQGFSMYQKQRYAEAIALFQKAKRASSRHAFSRYNLAATLALMRHKNQTCQFEASLDVIFENLTESIRLDPRRKARAQVDRDFDSVRRTLRWQTLFQKTPMPDLKNVLINVDWFSAGEGVYGSLHSLRFEADGTLRWTQNTITDQGLSPHDVTGARWILEGTRIVLVLPIEKEPVTGTLSSDGRLTFDRIVPPMTEQKSECEG